MHYSCVCPFAWHTRRNKDFSLSQTVDDIEEVTALHYAAQTVTGTGKEEKAEGWAMKHLPKVPKKFCLSLGLGKAVLAFLWRKLLEQLGTSGRLVANLRDQLRFTESWNSVSTLRVVYFNCYNISIKFDLSGRTVKSKTLDWLSEQKNNPKLTLKFIYSSALHVM